MMSERQETRRIVPLEQMAGFYPGLHYRPKDKTTCDCGKTWPCEGALKQIEQCRPYIPEFWYDDAHFVQLHAELERIDAAEAARKARLKEARAE